VSLPSNPIGSEKAQSEDSGVALPQLIHELTFRKISRDGKTGHSSPF